MASKKINKDPEFQKLFQYTKARIGLSESDGVVTTTTHLRLRESLAKAKDAIQFKLDWHKLQDQISQRVPSYKIISQAKSREDYLMKPHKGRLVEATARTQLEKMPLQSGKIDIVIADGLSPYAIESYALGLLDKLDEFIPRSALGQIFFVENGRVGIGDDLGEISQCEYNIVLIGERPGLSSFDSLGAYLTYRPRAGRQDSDRNCVSNICQDGLPLEMAARKISYLLLKSLEAQQSGVMIKENEKEIEALLPQSLGPLILGFVSKKSG